MHLLLEQQEPTVAQKRTAVLGLIHNKAGGAIGQSVTVHEPSILGVACCASEKELWAVIDGLVEEGLVKGTKRQGIELTMNGAESLEGGGGAENASGIVVHGNLFTGQLAVGNNISQEAESIIISPSDTALLQKVAETLLQSDLPKADRSEAVEVVEQMAVANSPGHLQRLLTHLKDIEGVVKLVPPPLMAALAKWVESLAS